MMEIKTIKDIAKFIRTGKTPPTQEVKYFDGDVNWYTPGDLDKGKYLSTSKRTLTNLAFEDKKAVVFPKNTLIVGCIGDIGKLGITVDECSSNQQLTGIYPNDNVDVNYLYYWFKGNKGLIDSYANNAVVPILNNRTLETIKLPLPPLPQQQKIANILDAADALRQNDKALIAKYDELTQALFLDMFGDPVKNEKGWEKIDLGKLTKRIVVGHVGPTSDGYSKEGVPFLRTQNVRPNFINYKDIMFVKKEFHIKLRKSQIYSEDILISRVGVNRGMAAVVPSDLNEANCANVVIVGSSSYFNSLYISFFLNKSFGTKPEYGYSVGSAQGVVNTSIVKKWPVFKIPLDLQNQFSERVKQIEEQKAIAQKSLEQSERLFNSLLQKAFRGELE